MTLVGAEHVDIVVFVGAHPVGDGLQGVFHAHRLQGGSYKKGHLSKVVQDFKGPDR